MRISAIIVRVIRQFLRDRRSLALLLLAPILVLWLMDQVFGGALYQPKIAVIQVPAAMEERLEKNGAEILSYNQEEEANLALEEGKLDAILIGSEAGAPRLILEGSDPGKGNRIIQMLQMSFEGMTQAPLIKPEIHYYYGSAEMSLFDNIGPVLLGFFAFFFVFLLSGVSLLRERTTGTLERILATPLKRWELVVGYLGGFGFFAIIQSFLITWFAIEVIDMMQVGSIFYVLLVILLIAMSALALGTFLSTFANNELQMIQFIPIVIVPQVFFSGLFETETMAPWLQGLGKAMPLTYGAEALRNIMIRGKGWEAIQWDVLILLLFTLIFMFANIFALRKHRAQ